MKNIIKTTAIVVMMALSATAIFAQTTDFNSGTTTPGGTYLTIKATFPPLKDLDHEIVTATVTVTWHDQFNSVTNQPVNGVKTGVQEFTFYDWSPIGGSQPVWVTYQISGHNSNNCYGHSTDGTYYLQSNDDVLYITTWKYTMKCNNGGVGGD